MWRSTFTGFQAASRSWQVELRLLRKLISVASQMYFLYQFRDIEREMQRTKQDSVAFDTILIHCICSRYKQMLAIDLACTYNVGDCRARANQLLVDWMTTGTK